MPQKIQVSGYINTQGQKVGHPSHTVSIASHSSIVTFKHFLQCHRVPMFLGKVQQLQRQGLATPPTLYQWPAILVRSPSEDARWGKAGCFHLRDVSTFVLQCILGFEASRSLKKDYKTILLV